MDFTACCIWEYTKTFPNGSLGEGTITSKDSYLFYLVRLKSCAIRSWVPLESSKYKTVQEQNGSFWCQSHKPNWFFVAFTCHSTHVNVVIYWVCLFGTSFEFKGFCPCNWFNRLCVNIHFFIYLIKVINNWGGLPLPNSKVVHKLPGVRVGLGGSW